MLVLSRKEGECVFLDGIGYVQVIRIGRDAVRLGFQIDKSVDIVRGELRDCPPPHVAEAG